MSSDEWITDDGESYYPLPEQIFDVSYTFDDEGLRMFADSVDDEVGSITWREVSSGGGDTYDPANMRLEVQSGNNIVIGYPEGEDALTVTDVNGEPEVFVNDLFGQQMNVRELRLYVGNTYHGAKITGDSDGDIVFHFYRNNNYYEVKLSDMFDWSGFNAN